MEPARVPEGKPQASSEEAYEDLIRQANQRLRPPSREPKTPPAPDNKLRLVQPPRPADTASELAGVKYEVDQRRRYVGPTDSRPAFELTPLRVTTLVLGAIAVLLWVRLIMVGTDVPAPPVDRAYAEAS